MTFTAVDAGDEDLTFAHDLTRENMAAYYEEHGRHWDTAIFSASWPGTENFLLLESDERIGILRLTHEGDELYVRDLQVLPTHQRRGAGTFALQLVELIAMERNVSRIRLSVFLGNPAQSLYRRLGFEEVRRKNGMSVFERVIGVPG